MPSTMIHLLVAHEIWPDAPGLFLVGNFAPDYTNDRQLKDTIHLRNSSDRWKALSELRESVDMENPFEHGWILHLFVDACWDETLLKEYQQNYKGDDWFSQYRQEIGYATYYLYHHMPWAAGVWEKIKAAQPSEVNTQLPITVEANELYRDRVAQKHEESKSDAGPSEAFPEPVLAAFAAKTSILYKAWK